MGIAMGCIGMRFQDFCLCTPSQFYGIYRAWQQTKEDEMKRTWEQTRFMALAMIQPHSKQHLKPADIIKFPWEKASAPVGTVKEESIEEIRKRFLDAKNRYGLE